MDTRLARGVATTEKAPFKAQAHGISPLSRGRRLKPRGKKKPKGKEARAAQAPRKKHFAGSDQKSSAPNAQSSNPKLRKSQTPKAKAAGRKKTWGWREKFPENQLPNPEKTSMAQRTSEKAMVRSPRK